MDCVTTCNPAQREGPDQILGFNCELTTNEIPSRTKIATLGKLTVKSECKQSNQKTKQNKTNKQTNQTAISILTLKHKSKTSFTKPSHAMTT